MLPFFNLNLLITLHQLSNKQVTDTDTLFNVDSYAQLSHLFIA